MANNLSNGQRMRAKAKSIVSASALTASYVDKGSALNIRNMHDPTLYLAETANVENVVVKFFLSPDLTTPADTTALYQLVDAAGAEIETTVVKNTTQVYPLRNVAAQYFFLQGKGAVGTDGVLTASLLGNFAQGGDGSRLQPAKINIVSTATALTGTPTLIGNVVNIRGLSNLTLYVYNSDGAVNATITPYVSKADTAPAALADMYPLDGVNGVALTFVTIATERAAHALTGIAGDWLALAGSGNGADVVCYLFGTLTGHGY